MKYVYLISTVAFCITYLTYGCHVQPIEPKVRLVIKEEQCTDISVRVNQISSRDLEDEADDYAQELEAQEAPYVHLYDLNKKKRGLRKSENHRAMQYALRQSYYQKAKMFEEAFEQAYHSEAVINLVNDCANKIMSVTHRELQNKLVSHDLVPRNVKLNLHYTLGITYLLRNGTAKTVWKTNS